MKIDKQMSFNQTTIVEATEPSVNVWWVKNRNSRLCDVMKKIN